MTQVLTVPSERHTFRDEFTGVQVTRWTKAAAMHHHCYFTNQSVTADGRFGVLISYRSGYPNLWLMDLADGGLRQLTDRVDLNAFSPAPSPNQPRIFFSARQSVWSVDTTTGQQVRLATFDNARLGICSPNADGKQLAIGLRYDNGCALALLDTADGRHEIVLHADEVGHCQFSPRDPNLILYSGSVQKRMWLFNRAERQARPVFDQPVGQWIVHESWRGGATDEVIYPVWPHALAAIRPDGTGQRTIASINAWHVRSSPEGQWIVCDTNHPDRGLLLIHADTGASYVLCRPQATQRGTQWPYDHPAVGAGMDTSILRSDTPENDPPPHPDMPASTYGPQWTHPHPSFTPDGRSVVFTSDRGGWSHVYSVALPDDVTSLPAVDRTA